MSVTEGLGVGEEWPTAGVLLSLRYRLTKRLATSGIAYSTAGLFTEAL